MELDFPICVTLDPDEIVGVALGLDGERDQRR
jgi:hypothetical protein